MTYRQQDKFILMDHQQRVAAAKKAPATVTKGVSVAKTTAAQATIFTTRAVRARTRTATGEFVMGLIGMDIDSANSHYYEGLHRHRYCCCGHEI